MSATAHPLIPYLDLPLVCMALVRWKPPRGVDHQILLTPWPKGVEVSVTIRAGDDAPHFFKIPNLEPRWIIQRLSLQAAAILQASKVARGPVPGRSNNPLDTSWMGKDQ